MSRRILALGGGIDGTAVDDLILELAGGPRICYLPTATGDQEWGVVRFYERFGSRADASHAVFHPWPRPDLREHVLAQDAIFVGGGNTANMLAIWRVHGFDALLREAWEAGVLLCGWSAGMICWFEAGVTDSFGPELAGMRDGLGFLPGSACPHYDGEERRRPVYGRLVRDGFPAGYAADDGVGLVFDGTELREVVTATAGPTAYHVTADGEEPLEARLLVSREVKLSSADRVLYPESGITKGDVFDYYGRIAPVLVPHLRERPFTMKRWPHGIHGEAFFQKQAPRGMPDWIPTRQFQTQPRQGGPRLVDFPLLNSREAVLFMVQQNCIDMNAWYSRVDKPTRPDFVLFDLDPPDGEFKLGVKAAHLVREALDELELRSYVKTSGSEGIHVLVPIARRYGFEQTHRFAELLSKRLAAENPGVVTTEWLKRKRVGVLIDFHQNGAGRTIASAYSVRPKEGAPVSTPLRWEELTPQLNPGKFTMDAVLRRVEKEGDLFEPVLKGGQALGPALRRLGRV